MTENLTSISTPEHVSQPEHNAEQIFQPSNVLVRGLDAPVIRYDQELAVLAE